MNIAAVLESFLRRRLIKQPQIWRMKTPKTKPSRFKVILNGLIKLVSFAAKLKELIDSFF
jgi:hypothetical protein